MLQRLSTVVLLSVLSSMQDIPESDRVSSEALMATACIRPIEFIRPTMFQICGR